MTSQELAELTREVRAAVSPGARSKLVARGLSRGIIWRDGVLPAGAPHYVDSLSTDLLDQGYSVLAMALMLRDADTEHELVDAAFRVAAEAIESASRKDDPRDPFHGFNLVVAAVAFHLGHYAARSYCLIPANLAGMNLSSAERALALVMRRSFRELRLLCKAWLSDATHSDETVASRLEDSADDFDFEDAVAMALTRNFYRAMAFFDYAMTPLDSSRLVLQGTRRSAPAHSADGTRSSTRNAQTKPTIAMTSSATGAKALPRRIAPSREVISTLSCEHVG